MLNIVPDAARATLGTSSAGRSHHQRRAGGVTGAGVAAGDGEPTRAAEGAGAGGDTAMSAPRVSGMRIRAPRPSRTAIPEAAKIPEYAQRAMAPPMAGPRSSPTISQPWSCA